MELTYDNLVKWFETYFEDVRTNQGALETVPNLRKYFAPDLELLMYTSPSAPPAKAMSRDELLLSFVHPGLQEDIVPQSYVVDLKQMAVAVRFEIRFRDIPSGKNWPPLQASAHYHLAVDEGKEWIIRRIHYWTESLPGDLFEFWGKHRDEALAVHALRYLNSK